MAYGTRHVIVPIGSWNLRWGPGSRLGFDITVTATGGQCGNYEEGGMHRLE